MGVYEKQFDYPERTKLQGLEGELLQYCLTMSIEEETSHKELAVIVSRVNQAVTSLLLSKTE